ncbi:MAG: helix-hairpin-helix domain-containing protein [Bacteroidales bacterium]|nr:helix-hairpin-helix domain-containing protein [Bacteroidales bacterium]
MIRNFLKQYFTFSKAEKNGTLVLVVLIILVLAGYLFLPKIIVNRSTDYSDFEKEIKAFEQLISSAEDGVLPLKNRDKPFENMDDIQFFEFDPNVLSVDKWKHLGLSDKTINTIRKYLKKGGRFYKPEDLKKIYGLKMDWYKLAEPYIQILEIDGPDIKTGTCVIINDKKIQLVELNSADSLLLVDLPGIGPVLAGRILKYRNLLGGFVMKEQLLEVYGLPYETFEIISRAVNIDTTGITRIDLNKAVFSKLIRHPYLDVYTVRGILNYRDIQGNIKDVNELKTNRIIPEESFSRIKPYIMVSIEKSN